VSILYFESIFGAKEYRSTYKKVRNEALRRMLGGGALVVGKGKFLSRCGVVIARQMALYKYVGCFVREYVIKEVTFFGIFYKSSISVFM
jgi:hypothetical protein